MLKSSIKKIFVFVGIVGAVLSVNILQAQACKMSRDQKFNYFINSKYNYAGMFWEGRSTVFAPTVIEKCQESAGQYLMLGLGVRFPTLLSETSDISFDGKIQEGICKLENAPKSVQSFDEKKSIFVQNHRFLRQCTHLQVYDLDRRPIAFKPDQVACKVRSIGNGTFRLDGDFCFLKISPANRFVVSITVNEECKSAQFLKDNGYQPQDIEAALNAYVAGDDSGASTQLDPLGTSRARFYIQPSQEQIALTEEEDERTPRFPTVYTPDIHMGHVSMMGGGQTWTLDMSLFVDNRNSKSCNQRGCVETSKFNYPVVGDVYLYSLKGAKKTLIDNWWHAGLAVSGWQGLLTGLTKNINEVEIKPGDKFELETVFIDPYEDFSLFALAFQQFLIDLKAVEGTAGIDVIQSLQGLANLAGLSPLRSLPSLSGGDFNAELDRVLLALSGLNKDRQWPAYYSHVCNSVSTQCIASGKTKYFLKLKASFEVESVDEMSGQVKFKNIEIERDSKVSESYKRSQSEFTHQVCGDF